MHRYVLMASVACAAGCFAQGTAAATLSYDGNQGLALASDGNMARVSTMVSGPGAWVVGSDGLHPQGTSGKTVWIRDVAEAATQDLYWGPVAAVNSIGLSLRTGGYAPSEYLTFAPALSDLPAGLARWTGSTTIYIFTGSGYTPYTRNTRFTLLARDYATQAPVPLCAAGSAGLNPLAGAVVPLNSPSATFQVNLLFEVDTTGGGTWRPAYEYYNNAQTDGGGCKYTFNSQYYSAPQGALTIVQQPRSASFNRGETVYVNVLARGTGTLRYQWTRNGLPVSGATGASLAFIPGDYGDAGTYAVEVRDSVGTLTSAAAAVAVVSPPAGTPSRDFADPGLNGDVLAAAAQADGRLLIAGAFTTVQSQPRSRLARLNADGSLDSSFADCLANATVRCLAVAPDGRVLIGGDFTTVAGLLRARVARLHADGSVDTAFGDPLVSGGYYVSRSVHALALQADGRVLVGGDFTTVGGQTRQKVARLNADGTLDSAFVDRVVYQFVRSLAWRPDGKVFIGGSMYHVGGQQRWGAAQLNANGSLDTSFPDPLVVSYSEVHAVAFQADGKPLVAGSTTTAQGAPRSGAARFQAGGPLDTSFGDPGASGIRALAPLGDGRLLVGGTFTLAGGSTRGRVARLLSSGALDTSFVDPAADNAVYAVVQLPDGDVLIGGSFTQVGGAPRSKVARLMGVKENRLAGLTTTAGTLSPTFASYALAYTVPVATFAARVTVTPLGMDPAAAISVGVNGSAHGPADAVLSGAASRPLDLNVGANTLEVRSTGMDGGIRTYVLAVTRVPGETVAVLGINGAGIPPGDMSPDLERGTDFGPAREARSQVVRTFAVRNTGSETLSLSGVSVGGPHGSDFTVLSWPETVAVGASGDLTIRFDPSAVGACSASIALLVSGPTAGTYSFAVQGTCLAGAPGFIYTK